MCVRRSQIALVTVATLVTLATLATLAVPRYVAPRLVAGRVAAAPSDLPAPSLGLAAADAFVARQPGSLGIVVRDRVTGTVWRSGVTDEPFWTASTVKLAIATDLLEQQRAGTVALTRADRDAMEAALVDSDNEATNALWARYGNASMLQRFRDRFGMRDLSAMPGYAVSWHHVQCTAEDLQALMSYVLDRLAADDRSYLVDRLRHVADNQQWGVWAAGAGLRPGNKDGWADTPPDGSSLWFTHTVGFAGDGERYVVAVMYEQTQSGSLTQGVQAVSDLVATVFGAPVPARVPIPPP
jgi:hypothetical protein